VVGCALTYQDVNVTTALKDGQPVRLCNGAWSSFAEFDKVAFIDGSILAKADMEETQAMGLLQVLRAVDSSLTAGEALQHLKCTLPTNDKVVQLPNLQKLDLGIGCSNSTNSQQQTVVNVVSIRCKEPKTAAPSSIAEGSRLLPSMGSELVPALLSFADLETLEMDIGGGLLPQQLLTLHKLQLLSVGHYCLQGDLPVDILASLPDLLWLEIFPKEHAVGGVASGGGLCGLHGSLLHMNPPRRGWSLSSLLLPNNQITGQLPADLLSFAAIIDLSGNKISGSIPGLSASSTVAAYNINLSGNRLEVSSEFI
jgi:hypothetical protein